MEYPPTPVAARSKTWVCGLSFAGIVGSNPTGGVETCLLFQVEVSLTGWSLVQRNATECGVS
jgi:hypothetical protein